MGNDDYILVIDDDDDTRTLSCDVLARFGLRIRGARDGQEGLDCLLESRPVLVLLDLCLPRLTGWELVRRIRENPATAVTPIIVLTSFPMDERLPASLELPSKYIVNKTDIIKDLPKLAGEILERTGVVRERNVKKNKGGTARLVGAEPGH